MITGATSGIGRATALGLAERGARLVLVARNPARAEATVEEIRRRSGSGSAEVLLADLSSQAEIRRAAAAFLARELPLHVLINNAAVINLQRTTTVDGIETTFAVNHLSHFLLTALLCERIVRSAPARIVNVASNVHRFGDMDFDDLGGERSFRASRIYSRSKLANVLFTYELAARLAGTGVTVNCLHPGVVATGIGTNNGALARLALWLGRPFMRRPARGATTSIWLSSSPEVEGVTGRYFVDCQETRSSPASYDRETARRLWEVSERMTGLSDDTRTEVGA